VAEPAPAPGHHVPFPEAARFWVKLGFVNFGGPAGQIALMHHELVVRRRWIGERRFLHALSYCTFLPGPEAQQLAIYIGWLLHRTWGGIVAGLAFIVPAFFLMLVLAWTYAAHGDLVWVGSVFAGLAAAVVGIVTVALLRLAARALRGPLLTAIAATAFLAIHVVGVPFPFVVGGAALAGVLVHAQPTDHGAAADADDVVIGDDVAAAPFAKPSWGRSIRILTIGLAAWWLPLLAVAAWRGGGDTVTTEAFFFSRAAVVTFGGAYAVLAYVKQAAVVQYGWLSATDVAAGLGLAESTPGPLIMVAEFIGFLAAYRFPGDLAPLPAGVLGALVTVWATFAPCFLLVFLGAPFVERLRGNERLASALSGVTASVVGVIASLAVSFGVGVLFERATSRQPFFTPIALPVWSSVDGFAVALAVAAALAIQRFRVNVVWVVLAAAALGWLRSIVR
jgi:chromate transporter